MKRWLKKNKAAEIVAVLVLSTAIMAYTYSMSDRRLSVNPSTYSQLLGLIGRAESNGNYNAYFGNSRNTSIEFTKMKIGDVMKWQADFVAKGNASSAIGRYQIIDSTLAGLVRQLGINKNERFDEAMQDRMAIALLERRGAESYVNKELAPEQFAANIAREWAALPKVIGDKPDESYYQSDGLNKSRVTVDEVLQSIKPISAE